MAKRVQKNSIVTLAYRLTDGDGRLLEERTPENPMEYLHGAGQVVDPVERAVEGKTAGYTCEVTVSPREGYGNYDASLVAELPLSHFPPNKKVEVGMKFNTTGPKGKPLAVRVIEVDESTVTIDGNHPLAGLELIFDLKILDVRDPTTDELTLGAPMDSSGSGGETLH